MASRGKSICRHAGCGRLLEESGYCETHAKLHQRQSDEARGNANERGYTYRWRKARATYLKQHPLCVKCESEGFVRASSEVDHIVPPKMKAALDSGNAAAIAAASKLFWSRSNWQALCKPHHSRKTASEDGGFGRG